MPRYEGGLADYGRRNEIRKQNKPKMGKGAPLRADGNDGDEQIRSTSNGVMLFKKFNGDWYFVSLSK